MSTATAWLCLGLLSAALAIGPLRVLGGSPPQTNLLVRRDLGIWAGLTGLVHFWLGTAQSMNAAYLQNYVNPVDLPLGTGIRQALFTWGSLGGLVVAVLCVLLLMLSSNRALQLLGARWWTRLQRSRSLAFALTVAHGIAFQALEGRAAILVAALLASAGGMLVLQLAGRHTVRRRSP
jgi:sulfoxide reductase heme-binding subunit YedZ